MAVRLSKSDYTLACQCEKALWLKKNMPHLLEHDEATKAKFETGHEVGELAKGYFGPYEEVEFGKFGVMAHETKQWIESGEGKVLCEATFKHGNLLCMVDLLVRRAGGKFDIVECKSSTKVKPYHLSDIAFQAYVAEACGVEVRKCILMHIDKDYVRAGDLSPRRLFTLEDVTEDYRMMKPEVSERIERYEAVAGYGEVPDIQIGCHCTSPNECGFKGHCWAGVPEGSVHELAGATAKTKFAMAERGVKTLEQIGRDDGLLRTLKRPLARLQALEAAGRVDGVVLDAAKVSEFLAGMSFPLHFLDFETVQPLIPRWRGTRPYQQLPTQFSLHTVEADGSIVHKEFLARQGADPRRAVADALASAIPEGSCSVAWNMRFEKGRIGELAEAFPDLAAHLGSIAEGMVDLMVPFSKGWVYVPGMRGSASIKAVLPAMFPDSTELDYHALDGVHNGVEAMDAFLRLEELPPDEAEAVREQLLRYCELDTLAMVRIWEALVSWVTVGSGSVERSVTEAA